MTNNQYETMLSIYPNFTDCSIQTFDDNKTKWHQKDESIIAILDQRNYTSQQMEWMLTRLNDRWAWIYFSVNSMKHFEWNWKWNVLWYRKKEYVTRLNAWICDIDWYDDKKWEWWYTKEDQLKAINEAPIKPNIIVESWHWYHLYRFIQWENWSAWVECNENTIEQWTKVCWWICNHFKWDVHIPTDYSRVLRVPWFQHKKDPSNPFVCNMELLDWTYHTYDEMIKAYPNWEKIKKENDKVDETLIRHNKKMLELRDSDWAWYNINALDAMDMLYEISWKHFVNYETFDFKRNNSWYQILVNWEPKSCWIDKNWLIWSYDDWWPTWVNWVKYYRIWDVKEIYQYIKDNHPECIPEKKQPTKLQNYKEALVENNEEWEEDDLFTDYEFKEVDFSSVVPFTWGIEELNNKFWRIDYWKFIAAVWESWAWKTTYTFFQATQNANMWHKVCYVSLEQDPWELLLLKALKRYWISKWDWDNKTITEQQKQSINNMIREYGCNKNMRITKVNNPTLERLCKAIIKAKSEWYMLFYIDNLWIILSDKWSSKEYDMVTECSRVFMTLAHEEWVTIILLHHFNQWNSVSRFAPRTLADIRWWAKLEHDCDLVFQVRRNLDYEDTTKKNTTQIIVQKNRQWGTEWSMEIKFIKWWYEPITNDDELESPI